MLFSRTVGLICWDGSKLHVFFRARLEGGRDVNTKAFDPLFISDYEHVKCFQAFDFIHYEVPCSQIRGNRVPKQRQVENSRQASQALQILYILYQVVV